MRSIIRLICCSVTALTLFGCAATQTAISKRNLDVQTKMSDSVFLDPVTPKDKTIFVQIKNTSDKPDIDVASPIKQSIAAKGYRLMDDPDQANFILQANILSVSKSAMNPNEGGVGAFGSALTGAGFGALASAATGGSNRNISATALAVGALAGLGSMIGNALVSDVYYYTITDLQIKQKTKAGVKSQVMSNQKLKNGSAGTTDVVTAETGDYRAAQWMGRHFYIILFEVILVIILLFDF